MRVRGQCDQRTHYDRSHRMDWMPDLSDRDALQGPPGESRPAAEDSAPSREAEFDVDLFVIGGGSGGVRAARVASGHGGRLMLAEEYRLGGKCIIRGCVPKKLFVCASRFSDTFDEAAEFGWRLSVATGTRGRRDGKRVIAKCPFMSSYAARHPEYGALLDG